MVKMADNRHYNKYSKNEYEYESGPYQVKAEVVSDNRPLQQFGYGVGPGGGYESNTHLSSLSNCVKRLQTSLNQYLTKIIDEGSDGPTNYNLGSGEVLNSHLMEQYSAPNSASAFQGGPGSGDASAPPPLNNGYSYYSNYPANYPTGYHHHHQAAPPPHQYGYGSVPPSDYYNQQYGNFQEPKSKKQKNK